MKKLTLLALTILMLVAILSITLISSSAEETILYGDANGDGKITIADLTLLKNYFANYDYETGKSTVILGKTVKVTWKNYDGSVLQSVKVKYGTIPTYDGETPIKEIDDGNKYSFLGWDKIVSEVTEDTEYIAQFDEVKQFSKGLSYTLKSDDTYEVSGIGTCVDTELIIPSTYDGKAVTSIGNYAFEDCAGLTSVEIGNSVKSIGNGAFDCCTGLEHITIPDSITSISSDFYSCDNLQYNIYDNAKYLGNIENPCVVLMKATNEDITGCIINCNTRVIYDGAFQNCGKLISVSIPTGIKEIGEYSFSNCSSLETINIPESVTYISEGTFNSCDKLHTITLPNTITKIGSYSFANCTSLKSIDIGNSVKTISQGAFYNCSELSSIVFPNSVMYINDKAFAYCSKIESIFMSDNILILGDHSFFGCENLSTVSYNGTKTQWNSVTKGSGWNSNTGNYTIYCTDGNITK